MIGRAAHIAFLENSALIKLSVYSFDELFEWLIFIKLISKKLEMQRIQDSRISVFLIKFIITES